MCQRKQVHLVPVTKPADMVKCTQFIPFFYGKWESRCDEGDFHNDPAQGLKFLSTALWMCLQQS
jgi:hypothetical protein